MTLIVPSGQKPQTISSAELKRHFYNLEMIDPETVECLEYRVLLKIDDTDELTQGGIIKPEAFFEKEMYAHTQATLVSMGSECFMSATGDYIENRPVIGDKVITAKYAGNVYRDKDNNLYRFANDKDVVGIVRVKQ